MTNINNYLFEYDNNFLHIGDSFRISENYCVEDYLYGRCHIFALALSSRMGYKIGAIIDDNPYHNINGYPCLEHAFCIIDEELVIDARGIKSKEEIIDEYGFESNEIVILDDAKDLLEQWIKLKRLDKSSKKELMDLEHYIIEMQSHKMFELLPNAEDYKISKIKKRA